MNLWNFFRKICDKKRELEADVHIAINKTINNEMPSMEHIFASNLLQDTLLRTHKQIELVSSLADSTIYRRFSIPIQKQRKIKVNLHKTCYLHQVKLK